MNMWRFYVWAYRKGVTEGDKHRDMAIEDPKGVASFKDIRYAKGKGDYHLLDVYRPMKEGTYPLVIIVHGGGWVYGDKKLYGKYAMDIARRGFVTICFNYVLAPHEYFPKQLEELDEVCDFASKHATEYGYEPGYTFLAGDSAGAQMVAQYSAAYSNPEYAKLFNFHFPLKIKAIGLNCGVYSKIGDPLFKFDDTSDKQIKFMCKAQSALLRAYKGHAKENDPRLEILPNINATYPPAYVITSEKDFVKSEDPKLLKQLDEVGAKYVYKEYTSKEGDKLQHVFHLIINEEHAILANDEECAFFRKTLE
jgi:acetyl esterase/lipase